MLRISKRSRSKKESAQPVLPETKAQKAANPRLSETPKEEVEGVSGSALKDVEGTAKALEGKTEGLLSRPTDELS